MKTNRVALLLSLVLLAGACAMPASSDEGLRSRVLPESVWGSEQETFTVLADRATFEGLCVDGAIEQNIVVDDAGSFTAEGTLRRRGGARIDDAPPATVRYEGMVRGETLTLTITGPDHTPILTATLRKGIRGQARPCA